MPRRHVFIDTSIFLHILRVPGYNDPWREQQVQACLKYLIESNAWLYLPLTTIFETGNHIARIADGELRRQSARIFIKRIREAFHERAPWRVAPFVDPQGLEAYLARFENDAMQGLSFGDGLLIGDAVRRLEQFAKPRGEEVCIWTLDNMLRARSPSPCPSPCQPD